MKRIVLLSDTHNYLDDRIHTHLKESDEIWHAGDIGRLEIIDQLRTFSLVRAVYGNIDDGEVRKEFKSLISFSCEDMNIIMTHIGGYPGRYKKEIKEILKENRPNIFISGHSHILKVIYDKELDLIHMNPGAIGNYGIHQVKTILKFKINGNRVQDLNVIEYPR